MTLQARQKAKSPACSDDQNPRTLYPNGTAEKKEGIINRGPRRKTTSGDELVGVTVVVVMVMAVAVAAAVTAVAVSRVTAHTAAGGC